MKMEIFLALCLVILFSGSISGQWRMMSDADHRQELPSKFSDEGKDIKVGDAWPNDQRFRWLVADLEIPESIDGKSTKGKAVGLQFNCSDGGEVYVRGRLQCRYDNDHPALVLLSDKAIPHEKVPVAVQVFGVVQGGGNLGEASIVFLPEDRTSVVKLTAELQTSLGTVPHGLIGLSQGGGMSDYDDSTAAKLQAGGFKWFRMDNILTSVLKKDAKGRDVYDWADFDRRLDFIYKIGADPIFAASYMPQVLDAVPNNDRQSAPKSYEAWEELCYQAAKHGLDRGKRVKFWEVWNEANAGWIKPGPNDTGSEEFKDLYGKAIGNKEPDHEIVRRFEAYAKVYRATARGVRRADPEAKVGGPALASGPFEQSEQGSCTNGKGFARGLMLWCQQEDLPLDFVSWHEYFQPSDIIAKEADAFRVYLKEFPKLQESVKSLMITEWNEAWWPNRPHDHEIGAAWCADGMIRTIIPKKIDRPCLFYVKQGDMSFRGDWSILMQDNRPKPTFNMARIFNSLSGDWVRIKGEDDDVCAVAALDSKRGRLAIVLVNFRYRYALNRHVHLTVNELPSTFAGGYWQESVIDASHANIFTNPDRAELEVASKGSIEKNQFQYDREMPANSIVLLELLAKTK